MKRKLILAALGGFLATLAMPLSVFATPTTVVVDQVNLNGWSTGSTGSGGTVTFKNVSAAPLGSGALELKTDNTNPARAQLVHDENLRLDEVTEISYQAKQVAFSNAAGNAGFILGVDLNNDGTIDTSLIYEPYWQPDGIGDPAPVVFNTWQTWDVDSGLFWSTQSVGGLTAAPGGPPAYTLSDVLAIPGNENAVIRRVGVNLGTFNPGYTILVDAVVIGETTYDFEAFQPTGTITNPAHDGDAVRGTITLAATYNDGDTLNDDAVSWAVRHETCDANTATVFGNVDGHHDTQSWNGQNFSATIDTSALEPGQYCFVFNPTDDAGQNDVRVTRTFFVNENAPLNKDECKNGGWKSFTAPHTFKNQGDCVSYIASDGKAKGNPAPINRPSF